MPALQHLLPLVELGPEGLRGLQVLDTTQQLLPASPGAKSVRTFFLCLPIIADLVEALLLSWHRKLREAGAHNKCGDVWHRLLEKAGCLLFGSQLGLLRLLLLLLLLLVLVLLLLLGVHGGALLALLGGRAPGLRLGGRLLPGLSAPGQPAAELPELGVPEVEAPLGELGRRGRVLVEQPLQPGRLLAELLVDLPQRLRVAAHL
mmetsp:Transcript_74138/g.200519  ORF Transcript_74138/g.200519 Transcript_74138/m.200519 type:complete len:204 (-) Transcript_74138:375-986(-)